MLKILRIFEISSGISSETLPTSQQLSTPSKNAMNANQGEPIVFCDRIQVTPEEWCRYYAMLSASMTDDDEFELMMR